MSLITDPQNLAPSPNGDRSASVLVVPLSHRTSNPSCIVATTSDPSGRNPRPDGHTLPVSSTVSPLPSGVHVTTLLANISDSHNRPSYQRGPSGKTRPSVSRFGVPAMTTPQGSPNVHRQPSTPHGEWSTFVVWCLES